MAKISNRNDFRDYVLRRLGYPVIEINVDDDQIEDRIDDGLQLFREYAADGQLRVFQPVQITQAHLDAKGINLDNAVPGVAGRILDVVRVFMIGDSTSNVNFFDLKYQMRLNDLADLATGVGDLAYYEQMQQYLSLIDLKLTGTPQIQFNRHSSNLLIQGDMGPTGDLKVGKYVMIEMFIEIADSIGGIYNNLFMKNYVTAVLKKQWGENISKFDGMTLPGGVQLNGRQLIEDAKEDIEKEIEKLRNEYDNPPNFFVG